MKEKVERQKLENEQQVALKYNQIIIKRKLILQKTNQLSQSAEKAKVTQDTSSYKKLEQFTRRQILRREKSVENQNMIIIQNRILQNRTFDLKPKTSAQNGYLFGEKTNHQVILDQVYKRERSLSRLNKQTKNFTVTQHEREQTEELYNDKNVKDLGEKMRRA